MVSRRLKCGGAQRGVSLLEVLVAVLILSLGFLGLAGLQLNALRNNEGAYQRSVAVMETYAIADTLRSDRFNAQTGALNGSTYLSTAGAEWVARLQANLGADATGAVACDGNRCTITITWTDSRLGTEHSVVTEVQL